MGRFFANDLHDAFAGWLPRLHRQRRPRRRTAPGGRRRDGRRRRRRLPRRLDRRRRRLLAEAGRTGRRESRCRLTLWAAGCFATSYHPLYGSPVDPRLAAGFAKQIAAFDAGLALLPHPVAPLHIPFEVTPLPGYLLPTTGRERETRPLVILTNGYDATVTEIYFATAVAVASAGFQYTLLRRARAGRAADRAGHSHAPRLGDGDPRRRRLRARASRRRSTANRPLGLEPRRLPRAARRQRRAAPAPASPTRASTR